MKEESASICFQLKLLRRHQAHERSSSILNTPALGDPLQLSQLKLSSLLLSSEVSPSPFAGKAPAKSLDSHLEPLRVYLSCSCLQYKNMTPILASGKGGTFSVVKTRYHP